MSGLTIDQPTQFYKAISSSNIIPGDILYLRGGRYSGNWTLNIEGTSEAPIIIKPYNNEPVIIDGSLTFGKPYIKLQDVEITNSAIYTEAGTSIVMNQVGCWLIGCYIHDLHDSGVNWYGSGAGGVVECFISQNHGDAIYTHNDGGGARLIARNLMLEQSVYVGPNQYSIHIFSGGENWLKDYTCQDNVIFGNAVHAGGGLGLTNFVYDGNVQYGNYAQFGRYSPDDTNNIATISNNIFMFLSSYFIKEPWTNLTEIGNFAWEGEPKNRTGYEFGLIPVSWTKFIPFTFSERWTGIQCSVINNVFSAEII